MARLTRPDLATRLAETSLVDPQRRFNRSDVLGKQRIVTTWQNFATGCSTCSDMLPAASNDILLFYRLNIVIDIGELFSSRLNAYSTTKIGRGVATS